MKLLLISLLVALPVVLAFFFDGYLEILEEFFFEEEGSWAVFLAKFSLWLGLGALLWRIYLVFTYKAVPPCRDEELPLITVVIPAYNESTQVLRTLRSVAFSDYPQEKLQIIAVDDGSKDDTWHWMNQAAQELGERIQLVQLPQNRGKRRALYEGFQMSRGEVLVTIDSDSEVDQKTLRHLISPFVRDSRVGAVAGNVRVLNLREGILPRMLDVGFTFSFDFMRASQSRVNTVMTTPGALSAYRRRAAFPLLQGWLEQRFCGVPANIGEDRALTNLILREGYHTLFAKEALVYTQVPTAYAGLCRMFLRWARSNVRETLVMLGFIFKRFRRTSALGARVNLLLHLHRMTVGEFFKLWSLVILAAYPLFFGVNLLIGAMTASLVPALVYLMRRRNSNFLWALPYSLFWLIGLSWISLYALISPHRTAWLTRGLKGTTRPDLEAPLQRPNKNRRQKQPDPAPLG